jgi:hypothetical protein
MKIKTADEDPPFCLVAGQAPKCGCPDTFDNRR